jgi:hypothetical protein
VKRRERHCRKNYEHDLLRANELGNTHKLEVRSPQIDFRDSKVETTEQNLSSFKWPLV